MSIAITCKPYICDHSLVVPRRFCKAFGVGLRSNRDSCPPASTPSPSEPTEVVGWAARSRDFGVAGDLLLSQTNPIFGVGDEAAICALLRSRPFLREIRRSDGGPYVAPTSGPFSEVHFAIQDSGGCGSIGALMGMTTSQGFRT